MRKMRKISAITEHFGKLLTLFRMDLFGTAHGWGEPKRPLPHPFLPKICHKYPTKMELGTAIPYLKKTQKIDESRDTLLEFC